ncbi:MAG: hypothetical protein R2860_16495 [Desulfobacterales bacterium]
MTTEARNAFSKKIKGVPILTKTLSMGEVNINEITAISREPVSSDMFKVPADYIKDGYAGNDEDADAADDGPVAAASGDFSHVPPKNSTAVTGCGFP